MSIVQQREVGGQQLVRSPGLLEMHLVGVMMKAAKIYVDVSSMMFLYASNGFVEGFVCHLLRNQFIEGIRLSTNINIPTLLSKLKCACL